MICSIKKTEKKLTECELLVMKAVWDSEEDLSLMEIRERVNTQRHKAWKPQTVSSFLARLCKKGYLNTYRKGRQFFYEVQVPLERYKERLAWEYLIFWHGDDAGDFLKSLTQVRALRDDEKETIKKLIS
jgi:predicted transcriptional regulator